MYQIHNPVIYRGKTIVSEEFLYRMPEALVITVIDRRSKGSLRKKEKLKHRKNRTCSN